jgi:hypothetical protein
MDFANFVINAGVEKNTLGCRRLASVNMRRDTDVSIALDGGLAGHFVYLPYLSQTALVLANKESHQSGNGETARIKSRDSFQNLK